LYAEVRKTTDAAAGHRLWIDGRNDMLANHPRSPLPPERREAFSGLPVAPYDPALRFILEVDVEVAPERIDMPASAGGVVPFERAGVLHLPFVGDLDVWWLSAYGGGVFVPMKDASAGTRTYGGGRYILDTAKGADLGGDDGLLVVDLNYAYNPSCAYDSSWVCPLAPPGNTVAIAVEAGELLA
jgi:uncharacterized protein (DUF1684 family)